MSSVTKMYGSFLVQAPRNCREQQSRDATEQGKGSMLVHLTPTVTTEGDHGDNGRWPDATQPRTTVLEMVHRQPCQHFPSTESQLVSAASTLTEGPCLRCPTAYPPILYLHCVWVVHPPQDLNLSAKVAERNLVRPLQDLGCH